jgi:hypothetical protein
VIRQSDPLTQDRTPAVAKLQVPTLDAKLDVPNVTFERLQLRNTVSIDHFTNHRLKYARPPELYLRHHAFLI